MSELIRWARPGDEPEIVGMLKGKMTASSMNAICSSDRCASRCGDDSL